MIHLLHCLTAMTFVRAPANVATTSSGTTYLQNSRLQVQSLVNHAGVCDQLSSCSASAAEGSGMIKAEWFPAALSLLPAAALRSCTCRHA